MGRLQETSLRDRSGEDGGEERNPAPIENFLRLGPLGTAFADSAEQPRVLLIDEIDKSDIDLPNDLLHIFEEGEFEIPELSRLPKEQQVVPIMPTSLKSTTNQSLSPVAKSRSSEIHFPVVIMTSNGERAISARVYAALLATGHGLADGHRQKKDKLVRIVHAHLGYVPEHEKQISALIDTFIKRLEQHEANQATDQLLNAIYLVLKGINPQYSYGNRELLLENLWKPLGQ